MRTILLMLFFFTTTLITFGQNITRQDITGNWNWQYDNGKHITEIKLSFSPTNNNLLQGNYCSVFYNGKKIDCVENESSFCLTLTQVATNIFEGNFQSFSHNGYGTIRLTYIPTGEKLNLQILNSQGIFYLPQEATFVR